MPQDKTLQFDGLRGLACLLVLIPHMRYFGFYLTEFFAFARFAQFGLYLFFFLSAYLISKSVFSDSREGLWQVWPTYAIRRFLRIVPLYLAVLLLDYSFFHFYFGTMGVRDLSALLGHIFFQEGRSALWTMPVEVRFYVLLSSVDVCNHLGTAIVRTREASCHHSHGGHRYCLASVHIPASIDQAQLRRWAFTLMPLTLFSVSCVPR